MLKVISSNKLLFAKRKLRAVRRLLSNRKANIDVFIKVDDPYSYLLVQALKTIESRFKVQFRFHVFQSVDPEMFPRKYMWERYSKYDAHCLSTLYEFDFPETQYIPNYSEEIVKGFSLKLVSIENEADFLDKAIKLLHNFWRGDSTPNSIQNDVEKSIEQLDANQTLLSKLGHYLGAMMHFEGEWYWGVDRLDHLEQRLINSGLSLNINESIKFNRTYVNFCKSFSQITPSQVNKSPIVLYWSARSPYSYIGLELANKLASHYHLPLKIKPVLPMMMRGMNVPKAKKMYIFLDTKREAQKLGLKYGFVADPLGTAVERCYALIDYAESQNKLNAFLLSFARGVNTEGIRADKDTGLKIIVNRCGLDWRLAKQQLQSQKWREVVETNLGEMFLLGCWGVPTIQYRNKHFWGQDRFYLLEKFIVEDLAV